MQIAARLVTAVTEFYRDINPATLSGAIDVVVVEREDGSMVGSPFHVRFGKLQLLRAQEKVVEMRVNGRVQDFPMKIGDAGEAFFVVETTESVPDQYVTSPIAHPQGVNEDVEYLELSPTESKKENVDESSYNTSTVPHSLGSATTAPISPEANALGLIQESELAITKSTESKEQQSLGKFNIETKIVMPEATESPIIPTIESKTLPVEAEVIQVDNPLLDDGSKPLHIQTRLTQAQSGSLHNLSSPLSPSEPKTGTTLLNATADKKMRRHQSAMASKDPPAPEYPVSDTELDRELSGQANEDRNNPVSDSEVEMTVMHESHSSLSANVEDSWTWGWGQLPQNKSTEDLINLADAKSQQAANQHHAHHHHTVSGRPVNRRAPLPTTTSQEIASQPVMSLCGISGDEVSESLFNEHIVTRGQFLAEPERIINSPNLVLRIDGMYLRWQAAAPVLVSKMFFNRDMPMDNLSRLMKMTAAPQDNQNEEIESNSASVGTAQVDRKSSRYSIREGLRYLWKGSSNNLAAAARPPPAPQTSLARNNTVPARMNDETTRPESNIPRKTSSPASPNRSAVDPFSGPNSPPPPNSIQKYHTDGAIPKPTPPTTPSKRTKAQTTPGRTPKRKKYIKSLRLTSDQLKSMMLQYGKNSVSFTVTTKLQGRARCLANIFLWRHDSKVVISDIDGTITKSDALGHIFTMVGRDWTHAGVASLYSNIKTNGYQILYLTSRAIGQAQATRNYLSKVEQGIYQLPDGPVIMSPDRLLAAFSREIIQRRPEEFKIACLKDLKRLFGEYNPFYAGFGNRITDAFSYRAVNVPVSRIFTVDPTSEICLELLLTYKSSYVKLNDLVDQIFPPVNRILESEFSDTQYWKEPIMELPEIDESAPEDEIDVADVLAPQTLEPQDDPTNPEGVHGPAEGQGFGKLELDTQDPHELAQQIDLPLALDLKRRAKIEMQAVISDLKDHPDRRRIASLLETAAVQDAQNEKALKPANKLPEVGITTEEEEQSEEDIFTSGQVLDFEKYPYM